MKKLSSLLTKRLLIVIFIIVLFLIIATGKDGKTNYVSNINSVTSLQAAHIISKYDNTDVDLSIRMVSDMNEARKYGSEGPISFVGQMTGYGANCIGCGGKVSCPPRQDVRNGNIYYNDNEYGTVRILAADPAIPCGSIIRINNLTFSDEPIIGIVLDRGGAIKGNIIDFLVESEASSYSVGRQLNILFEVIRWGW